MSFKHRINVKEHALYEYEKKKTHKSQNQETSGAPDDVPNKTLLFYYKMFSSKVFNWVK